MTSFQTDPFEKYLYSSAFYIQIANCYRPIMKWIANGEPEQREVIRKLLLNSWHQATPNFLNSNLSGMGSVNATLIQENSLLKYSRLTQMLADIAPKIIDEFIDLVSEHANNAMTFEDFFNIWIETCDKRYFEFIHSEELIDCISELINFSLKVSTGSIKAKDHTNE
ncbi:MAG: hypothetical protein OXF60_01510 [Gammaproteobacteria bacterium]|nr:hypothetical protein [Gammaproteobacteria bacterium]MCY4219066.1 hypothetical protein [Gammaproteobacteria bacterium]